MILIAVRPVAPAYLPVIRQLAPVVLVRLITSPPLPAPPSAVELKRLLQALTTPPVLPRPTRTSAAAPVASPEGRIGAPPITTPAVLPEGRADPTVKPAPIEASLPGEQVRSPTRSRRCANVCKLRGAARAVLDEAAGCYSYRSGRRPAGVSCDPSAREQVLATWRFQPAIVNGHAVPAWANVPVTFALRS